MEDAEGDALKRRRTGSGLGDAAASPRPSLRAARCNSAPLSATLCLHWHACCGDFSAWRRQHRQACLPVAGYAPTLATLLRAISPIPFVRTRTYVAGNGRKRWRWAYPVVVRISSTLTNNLSLLC